MKSFVSKNYPSINIRFCSVIILKSQKQKKIFVEVVHIKSMTKNKRRVRERFKFQNMRVHP